MADKVFMDTSDLLGLLKSRGITIESEEQTTFASNALETIGYYNLINGYKHLFLDNSSTGDDIYKQGTTIEEIYYLYDFDSELKRIFLQYTLNVETHIKSLIAHDFPLKYSHNNYMLFSNFDTGLKDSSKKITSLISSVQKTISDRVNDPSIEHYLSCYGYVPIWVLNNILSFGIISKFYSLMKQPDRQAIAKRFGINEATLQSALFYLSKIRNLCAHNNRLYCFRNSTPYSDTIHHRNMGIPMANSGCGEYTYGKRDLFAAMIALKDLLTEHDFVELVDRTERILLFLFSKISVVPDNDVLQSLGFPSDWKTKLINC